MRIAYYIIHTYVHTYSNKVIVKLHCYGAFIKVLERSIKLLFDTKDISKVKSYVTKQCSRVLNGSVSISEYTFAREYRGKSGYRPGASVPALELTR